MIWAVVGAGIILVVAVVVLAMGSRKGKRKLPKNYAGADVYRSLLNKDPAVAPIPRDPKLEPLRQNLRVKILHQEEKVDAAIGAERERNPGGTLEEWMRAAIDRWERENR